MKTCAYYGLLLATLSAVEAHIALWNKGLFGQNYPGQANSSTQNYNTNVVVAPLRKRDNLTEAQWFGHGMLGYPPADGDFMELVTGEDYVGELACNRAYTAMRSPAQKGALEYYACPSVGPLHTYNKFNQPVNVTYLSGTAIAIAYTSDINTVKPTDFTVISINYTSVWTRETLYPIPSGMPACGTGGCLCTWNWFHQFSHGEGYGQEMYNTLYRCNVTGSTNSSNAIPLGKATVPVDCQKNTTLCVSGPKQPIYVFQATGNNITPDPAAPPAYNIRYGFHDGAQNDVFVKATSAASPSASPASSLGGKAISLIIALLKPDFLLRW